MGLLTEEVEVSINSLVDYFEDLGYEVPKYIDKNGRKRTKRGTKITVYIEDLKPGSHCLVPVECDFCHEKGNIEYHKYYKTTHSKTTEGKYACPDCMRLLFRGEKHPNWKSEKTQEERENQRKTEEYLLFIKKVSIRDNYTCRCCGKRCSKDLRVHHLNGYNWDIDGRIDPENAVCLCKSCHDNFHSIYGKGNNTKEQFVEWIGKTVENLKYSDKPLPSTRKIYCIEDDVVYNSAIEIRDVLNLKTEAHIYEVCNYASKIINNDSKNVKKHLLLAENILFGLRIIKK